MNSLTEKNHPEFAKLEEIPGLENLAKKLKEKLAVGQSCQPWPVHHQTKLLQESLNFHRNQYLKVKLLDNCLTQMILDLDLQKSNSGFSQDDLRQALKELRDRFTAAELKDHIQLLGDEDNTDLSHLLGLTKDDLNLKPLSKTSKSVLAQSIEEKLFDECLQILSQFDSRDDYEVLSTKEKFNLVCKLPEMIQTEVENVRTAKLKWRAEEEEGLRTELNILNLHVKHLETLQNLATKFKLGLNTQNEEVTSQYLSAKCNALALKIRCLEMDILNSTYNKESIQALKITRKHLQSRISGAEDAIKETKASLMQYESVGEEMEAIVNEYSRLQSEIEGKKWALQLMKEK